jgi:hypothetical protein
MSDVFYDSEIGDLLFSLTLEQIRAANPSKVEARLNREDRSTTYQEHYKKDLSKIFDPRKFDLSKLGSRKFPLSHIFQIEYLLDDSSEVYCVEPISDFSIRGDLGNETIIYETGNIAPHVLNQFAQRIKDLSMNREVFVTIPSELNLGLFYTHEKATPELIRLLEGEELKKRISSLHDNPSLE